MPGGVAGRSTTRANGATTTPRPTAGTWRSPCRTTARAWPTSTAAGTSWPRSWTSSSPPRRPPPSPVPTAASSTRCSRPATCGWACTGTRNQPSHHIPYMYDYAGQPSKTQARSARSLAAVPRQRDRPGLRRRRGQRRDVRLVPLQRAGLLPAADGQPDLRDRLAAVHQGDRPPGERQEAGRQRAGEQREERLRAGAEGRRQGTTAPRRCRTTCWRTAARSTSPWARSRPRGGLAPTPSTRR